MSAPALQNGMRHTSLQRWLRIDSSNRPKVYAQLYASTEFSSLNYWLGILFSAGIATFGLIENSAAVIIGAMLISPLMGPIMATGLGLAVGDLYLTLKAIANLIASISIGVGLAALIVWLLPFHSATTEIISRTNPTLLDLGIAVFSGLAGSVGVSRSQDGNGLAALPGVAIAVALMPPLCVVGFGLGSGVDTRIMGGAGLLFLTNLVAIISSAFLVFLLIGMSSGELAGQMHESRRGEFLALRLERGRAARAMTHTGAIGWRILVLVVLLSAIALPLKTAFLEVTGDAVARSAVQQSIKALIPAGALVSQQVDVGQKHISVRLFATRQIPADRQKQAQDEIAKKSGRQTDLSVATVASQTELEAMLTKMSAAEQPVAPAPTPPVPPPTVAETQQQLLARVTPVLHALWPAETPMSAFDLSLSEADTVLNVRYQGRQALTPIALGLITKQLQQQLSLPNLTLHADRLPEQEDRRRKNQRRHISP